MNQTTIQIDPEFEQYIPSLLPEELKQLEENILKDGAILQIICRVFYANGIFYSIFV